MPEIQFPPLHSLHFAVIVMTVKESIMRDQTKYIPRTPPYTPFQESVWILPATDVPEPFVLSSTGITRRDPRYHISRPKGAWYFVLECILAGRGHLFGDNRHIQPGPGDVYLLPPDLPNEYYTIASDPWEKIWFNISGDLIHALVDSYQLTGLIYLPKAGLEKEFRSGLEIVRSARGDAHTALAAQFTAIFSRMHHLHGHQQSGCSAEGILLKDYLDGHWREPFSLAELSRHIGKSPSQTLRIFYADYGITPGVYYQKRRFQMAIRYLEDTRSPIRTIANLLNFANEFHFSAWFKKQSGLSPKFYRNQSRCRATAGPSFP